LKLEEFIKALHVACTMPEAAKCARGFVSVAEYPRGFEPEDNEFGMIVERGQIVRRLVAV
jgi:hypothetical protein